MLEKIRIKTFVVVYSKVLKWTSTSPNGFGLVPILFKDSTYVTTKNSTKVEISRKKK